MDYTLYRSLSFHELCVPSSSFFRHMVRGVDSDSNRSVALPKLGESLSQMVRVSSTQSSDELICV